VPYVVLAACPFFLFKYYVDKYNISFVYTQEYQGMGLIKDQLIPLALFNIILMQITNMAVIAGRMKSEGSFYLTFGGVMIIIELVLLLCMSCRERAKAHATAMKLDTMGKILTGEVLTKVGIKGLEVDEQSIMNSMQTKEQREDLPSFRWKRESFNREKQNMSVASREDLVLDPNEKVDESLLIPSQQNDSDEETDEKDERRKENLRKLESAYRHPFEYVAPTMYLEPDSINPEKTPTMARLDSNTAYFFDCENEFEKTMLSLDTIQTRYRTNSLQSVVSLR